jgi:ribosome-associated protein
MRLFGFSSTLSEKFACGISSFPILSPQFPNFFPRIPSILRLIPLRFRRQFQHRISTNLSEATMTEREEVRMPGDFIELDKFLKLASVAPTGGEAKSLVRSGLVSVNGQPETRRGRKLRAGDVVEYNGERYEIEDDAGETP